MPPGVRPCTCDCFRRGRPFKLGRDCRSCWLYHNHPAYRVHWGGPPLHPPGPLRKAWNYAWAWARHCWDGFKNKTGLETMIRVRTCERCPVFDAAERSCTHGRCGCKIDKKAPWNSEHCPLGKW